MSRGEKGGREPAKLEALLRLLEALSAREDAGEAPGVARTALEACRVFVALDARRTLDPQLWKRSAELARDALAFVQRAHPRDVWPPAVARDVELVQSAPLEAYRLGAVG